MGVADGDPPPPDPPETDGDPPETAGAPPEEVIIGETGNTAGPGPHKGPMGAATGAAVGAAPFSFGTGSAAEPPLSGAGSVKSSLANISGRNGGNVKSASAGSAAIVGSCG